MDENTKTSALDENTKITNVTSALDASRNLIIIFLPLVISAVCAFIDIFTQQLELLNYFETSNMSIGDMFIWFLNFLITYYFPSIISTIAVIYWEFDTGINDSIIKKDAKWKLLVTSILYLVIYILYLGVRKSVFSFIFTIISIVYIVFLFKKCFKENILKGGKSEPNTTAKINPSAVTAITEDEECEM